MYVVQCTCVHVHVAQLVTAFSVCGVFSLSGATTPMTVISTQTSLVLVPYYLWGFENAHNREGLEMQLHANLVNMSHVTHAVQHVH